ncbi:MAG TPA: nitrogen regulation protein NR(II) [Rubrivivax sp.]|nr:nitrogen regulation protein NR(II) [Rubrivivax sp.]
MNAGLDAGGRAALDLLSTMVALVRPDGRCLDANAALESALGLPRRLLVQASALDWLVDPAPLAAALDRVAHNRAARSRFEAQLRRHAPGTHELPVHVIVSQIERGEPAPCVLVEMVEIEQQARLDREERAQDLVQAHQALVRNLAHEIGNPLGGIRGAAQLLALELATPDLAEYTTVIVHEADRLQALVDRLLAPHRRAPVLGDVNIHEICERVRALVLAEHARGLEIRRDYDASLPELRGDREALVQALLNLVRNAAQALAARIAAGDAVIVLRTRIARQVTLGRQRHRLALQLEVEDNGPGVPEAIRERIFQPLVSGRDGGSGLGLTLAQTLVQQHGGTVECDSAAGRTVFTVRIPLP